MIIWGVGTCLQQAGKVCRLIIPGNFTNFVRGVSDDIIVILS